MAARVSLCAHRPEHIPALAEALSDFETARWLSAVPWPYGTDQAASFIAQVSADDFAILVDGDFAGGIRCGDELGYWVHPRFRRQGVAMRAAVLALSRSFMAGREVVYASHQVENHASASLLARLGFSDPQPTTVFANALQREVPQIRLRLTRNEFSARHPVAIGTERLVMDQMGQQDFAPLYDIATDPRVARMLLRFYPGMPMAEFRAIISPQAAIPPFRLAIRHEGRVIGSIGIGDAGAGPPVFYFLSPDHWGQGLGGEILAAFLSEIDTRFALPSLSAEVFSDNPASARLLERHGFQCIRREMLPSKGRDAPAPGLLLQRQLPVLA